MRMVKTVAATETQSVRQATMRSVGLARARVGLDAGLGQDAAVEVPLHEGVGDDDGQGRGEEDREPQRLGRRVDASVVALHGRAGRVARRRDDRVALDDHRVPRAPGEVDLVLPADVGHALRPVGVLAEDGDRAAARQMDDVLGLEARVDGLLDDAAQHVELSRGARAPRRAMRIFSGLHRHAQAGPRREPRRWPRRGARPGPRRRPSRSPPASDATSPVKMLVSPIKRATKSEAGFS